jgi:hypothetical protein
LRQHDTTPESIPARRRVELGCVSADTACHLSNLRPEGAEVILILSVGAGMFLLGLFFGAGLYESGARPLRKQNEDAMRELALSRMEIDTLIEATGELATLNHHILNAMAQKDSDRHFVLSQPIQGKPS